MHQAFSFMGRIYLQTAIQEKEGYLHYHLDMRGPVYTFMNKPTATMPFTIGLIMQKANVIK
jgi:hypothetical protein